MTNGNGSKNGFGLLTKGMLVVFSILCTILLSICLYGIVDLKERVCGIERDIGWLKKQCGISTAYSTTRSGE